MILLYNIRELMMRCVIGLGNPAGYERSRHNVGKIFLDSLTDDWESVQEGSMGVYKELILFKTNTFMNVNGPPVKSFLKRARIGLEEIIVACDDVDLVLGKVKVKNEGSASGHNGLRSLISSLGTNKFRRLKIGISRPTSSEISDYVLSNFSNTELALLTSLSFPACLKLLSPPPIPLK